MCWRILAAAFLSRLFRFGDDAVSGVRAPARHGRRRYRRFRICGRISATNKPLWPTLTVIVAVSSHVGVALRERAPQLGRARIEVIPNGVDAIGVLVDADATTRPLPEPYAVFAGKLANNKGAHMLVDVASLARLSMPLVVIGDGPEREQIERAAAAAGRDVRLIGWRDRQEVFRWLRHAELLIFPSVWPEPLSRVLIEASALSVPIAAMNTGGTRDIIVDEETGLLSDTMAGLSADVARLASDGPLRERPWQSRRQAGRLALRHPRRGRTNGSAVPRTSWPPTGGKRHAIA